jgi:hypothetical protein
LTHLRAPVEASRAIMASLVRVAGLLKLLPVPMKIVLLSGS